MKLPLVCKNSLVIYMWDKKKHPRFIIVIIGHSRQGNVFPKFHAFFTQIIIQFQQTYQRFRITASSLALHCSKICKVQTKVKVQSKSQHTFTRKTLKQLNNFPRVSSFLVFANLLCKMLYYYKTNFTLLLTTTNHIK